MKHVVACSSAREVGESCFYHSGGSARLVHACLCAGNT